jgi:tetratricopeptide (TPR) repeat protein
LKPHTNARNARHPNRDRAPAYGGASSPEAGSSDLGTRLDSWKEIAGYLNRHVTTVRRWEKQEALPTHRHVHCKLGSVYAYTGELDAWIESRQPEDTSTVTALLPILPGVSVSGQLPAPPELACPNPGPAKLIGRARELKLMGEAWKIASGRKLQLVCLTGEPGQGKTRLALDFAREVLTEATILIGECDREAVVSFAPFVSILGRVQRAMVPGELQRRLKGIAGATELAELVPGISEQSEPVRATTSISAEGRRFRMFEAYTELLRTLSTDCPMLLVLEDFQWADRGSALLLRHLVRSARDAAICIVVTYSESDLEPSGWLQGILGQFQRESGATRITLQGLSEDETQQFIRSWTVQNAAPAITDLLFQKSEGNPLFLVEILANLEQTNMTAQANQSQFSVAIFSSGLPHSIRELIGLRLARLSPTSNQLLRFAAVIGRTFRFSLIEDLTGLDETVVLDALEEAVSARVIVEKPEAPGSFSFTHVMIQETLYTGMSAARRMRLHRRIGETIERGAEPDKLPVGELAYHFGIAAAENHTDKAVDYGIRAGDRASLTLAFEDAARYYGIALHALELAPLAADVEDQRSELLSLRGRCFWQAGQWQLAKAEFEKALAFLSSSEQVKRCELLVKLAETSFWLMDVQDLRRFASEARVIADQIRREDLWADARALMASAEIADGDVLGGLEIDRRTIARVGGIRSFAMARVPLTLYWAGETIASVERGAEAVEQARSSGDAAFMMYALQHFGLSLSGAGQYDQALQIFDEACVFGRSCGALPLLARATSMSVAPLLCVGDYQGAKDRALQARELAYRVDFTPAIVSAGLDLLLIAARSHNATDAECLIAEIETGVEEARGWHAWKWKLRLAQAHAEIALESGDLSNAIRSARDVVQQSRLHSRLKYEALGLAVLARARHQLGMREAVTDARAGLEVARRLRDPAVLLQCIAVQLEVDGNDALLLSARKTVEDVIGTIGRENLRKSFLRLAESQIGTTLQFY